MCGNIRSQFRGEPVRRAVLRPEGSLPRRSQVYSASMMQLDEGGLFKGFMRKLF